jgi:SAM-dependent methyltransferase
MEEISAKTQMMKIRSFEKGFMATHLINLGNRIGVFENLHANSEGLTITELAANLNLHEPYIKVWCQTAFHFEIVDCDEQGRFKLQPFLDEILGDKSHFRNYLANITMDVDLIGQGMPTAVDYFRTGEKMEIFQSPDVSDKIYTATQNIPLAFIFMILPKNEELKLQFEQGIKLLDIGCGNANFIIQMAQGYAKSTFVGVGTDIHGVNAAKSAISQMGLEDRVTVEHIGGQALPYRDEFDLATMVVTLHEILPDVRPKVVENTYHALKPGGKLLILDFPYPSKIEDFRNPLFDYGILDQFYEICAGTVHLNREEQTHILTETGFRDIQRMTIGKGMFEFVAATK